MKIITLKHAAQSVGRTERRVRQVVDELQIGTAITARLKVLNCREFSQVKRHFAKISKKRADGVDAVPTSEV